MKEIYYDNSATTRLDDEVLKSMLPYFGEHYGNPSSIHGFGQRAQSAVDEAREKIAGFLGCETPELIFTAGATESNNLVLRGVAEYFLPQNKKIHVITSKIEHPAVLEAVRDLEKRGLAEVTYVGVNEFGAVDVPAIKAAIKDNTALISIMYANNEVGAIQPLAAIAAVIEEERARRGGKGLPLYFHTDAVQAFQYLPMKVDELGVDFLSFSGHKIYGPKGVGGLYLRRGVKILPLMRGGHHEYNLRPGTLNVPSIVGLAKAVELVARDREKNIKKLAKIKSKLDKGLAKIADCRFNGAADKQLPNIINVSFKKAEGESILMLLDMEGIAVSTGSACSSGALEPSHVLTAMGLPPEWSHGSVRISLGKDNTEVEATVFLKAITAAVEKLRKMAP